MTLADDLALRSQTLGQTIISNLSRWYQNGFFYSNAGWLNWYLCTLAPASLMATLAKYTTNLSLQSTYLQMVAETVDRAITQNVNSAGVFTGTPEGPAHAMQGETFFDTSAIEAVASIGWILMQTTECAFISAAQRARWLECIQTNCVYMDTVTKNTTYYINGNYQAHLLNAYWFTAAVSTGLQKAYFEDCYERALAFMINPSSSNPVSWAGYGLVVDTSGVQPDWSDMLKHLTETPGYVGPNPSPEFDIIYSTLQLDLLARLFVVNRDYRINQLMNAISNKVEPFIDGSTWVIDGTTGSRQHGMQGYVMSWYQVTALLGCKAVNKTFSSTVNVLAQWDSSIINNLTQNSANGNMAAGTFRQLPLCIGVVREAASQAQIKLPSS